MVKSLSDRVINETEKEEVVVTDNRIRCVYKSESVCGYT